MAPLAVNVAEVPEQIAADEEFIVIIGNELTVKLRVSKFEQPIASVPTTVYEVVVVGETTSVDVVVPVLQEYVIAPVAVKVAELPTQTTLGEADTVKLGNVLTVKLTVSVLTQPITSVPVTV